MKYFSPKEKSWILLKSKITVNQVLTLEAELRGPFWMKFNEKFEQIQRESDQHKLFKAFEGDIEQLISKTSHSVSFQLAYDHVFKLTKMGKQPEILNRNNKLSLVSLTV